MKFKSRLYIVVMAAACCLPSVLISTAFAQAPIVIKFSHVVASDTPKGKAAERFKELAEKIRMVVSEWNCIPIVLCIRIKKN